MDHHTVHIVGGAARKLLGPHIFQAGSHLSKATGDSILRITTATRKDWMRLKTWLTMC